MTRTGRVRGPTCSHLPSWSSPVAAIAGLLALRAVVEVPEALTKRKNREDSNPEHGMGSAQRVSLVGSRPQPAHSDLETVVRSPRSF